MRQYGSCPFDLCLGPSLSQGVLEIILIVSKENIGLGQGPYGIGANLENWAISRPLWILWLWALEFKLLMGHQNTKCWTKENGWALRKAYVRGLGPMWKIGPLVD